MLLNLLLIKHIEFNALLFFEAHYILALVVLLTILLYLVVREFSFDLFYFVLFRAYNFILITSIYIFSIFFENVLQIIL